MNNSDARCVPLSAESRNRQGSADGETQWPIFMHGIYTGDGHIWSSWINLCEQAAQINGWDEATQLDFLGLLLQDTAQGCLKD